MKNLEEFDQVDGVIDNHQARLDVVLTEVRRNGVRGYLNYRSVRAMIARSNSTGET